MEEKTASVKHLNVNSDRNYFEYVGSNANEYDIDNPSLDNDSISLLVSLVSESTIVDDSDRDCEIDVEIEDKHIDSASIFEQESELNKAHIWSKFNVLCPFRYGRWSYTMLLKKKQKDKDL
ncbi:10314_t:CDS:2 [Ambispora gerdemannii]|uniref:10314_t:CDS:1 n=1 Tax=Ambispora gerdemannii TaxID=144530 RepID=A0A9N8WN93_9GLOM|nr:10314_t:CDS:2 [Ambispora gerdemannii]